jgi:cyanophycinase
MPQGFGKCPKDAEMNVGSIALVGSGEYLPVMQPVESELLRFALDRGRPNRYIQLATAAGKESPERLKYWQDLGTKAALRIGADVDFIPVFSREHADIPEFAERIRTAGLIYLSGGDPQHLAKSLTGTLVGEAIIESWQAGASLAGCSAGAIALGTTVPHVLQLRPSTTPGLDVASGIHVLPHFDRYFGWAPDRVKSFVAQFGDNDVVIGIDEDTALVRHDGDWVVSGVGKVHCLSERPIRVLQHGDVY